MIAYWQVYCNKIMAVINFMKMIKKILYTLALATIFSWVTTDLYAQKKTEIQLVDAVQDYVDGNYMKALAGFSNIVLNDSENDAAWYYKGLCEIFLNQPDAARDDIKKAIAIDSSNFWYRETLSRIYTATGQKDLAIASYEQLIKDFPKKTDIFYSLVNFYLNDNQLDKALKTIDEIEAVAGKSDPTVMTRYRILLQQNKPEQAHDALIKYNDEYSSPQILSMLGDHEMGMYNDSSAIAYYDEALVLDKDYAPAIIGKAETFRLTRKYPDFFHSLNGIMENNNIVSDTKAKYFMALLQNSDQRFTQTFRSRLDSALSIGLAHHQKDSIMSQTAGMYYVLTQRKELAHKILEENMQNWPDSKSAAILYIELLMHSEEWAKLASEAETAYSKFDNDIDFLQFANVGHYNLKDYKAIIRNGERQIEATPSDTSVTLPAYSNIGDMYHLLGDSKKAYKYYEKALKINPNYAPVLNNYAYYLSEEGKNLKKAYRMSKKAIAKNPDNATYLDTFGWILHLMHKDLEAKPFFKHAMLYGGKDSAVILLHYAEVLDRLGEKDLAEVYRSQAKKKQIEE